MKYIPLYIHVPFCRIKCDYCTFYSTPLETKKIEILYIDELISQIEHQMVVTGSSGLKTVFIGGGTPSSLSPEALGRLFSFLSGKIDENTEEVTIECNPEDITEEFINRLKRSPVNRISLGVQSFSKKVLEESGRRTLIDDIDNALSIIQQNWKGRFSIDLISGLPAQTLDGQLSDITRAVSSGVDHISCYSLILEDETPISNHPLLPDPEDEERQWRSCRDYLLEEGFDHYEVSNFARKGSESRHNLQYWRMNEYLGCGPGAVGMYRDDSIVRLTNPRNLNLWLEGKERDWGCTKEIVSNADFLFENYMMGLRTSEGLNRSSFKSRFGYFPEYLIKQTINKSQKNTFILEDNRLALSSEAMLFMNPVLININEELSASTFDFEVNWP